MGCRAQIAVQTNGSEVYLYTHWRGDEINAIAAAALDRGRDRWHDPEYLARIVFDVMTRGDKATNGYGIGTSHHGDLEYPVVHIGDGVVFLSDQPYPFEEFIERFGT